MELPKYSHSEDKYICYFALKDEDLNLKNNKVFETLEEGVAWGFEQVQEHYPIREWSMENFIRRSEGSFEFQFPLDWCEGHIVFGVRKIRINHY